MGKCLIFLKRYEEAIDKFKKAIDIKPDYYEVYFDWATD
jgi:tetratricopeptide (TPR) repeat protein